MPTHCGNIKGNMFAEFEECSPLLDSLGRWLRPAADGDWLPPRVPGKRRVVSRQDLLAELLAESAAAAQLPVEWLARHSGPLAQRIAALVEELRDEGRPIDAGEASGAVGWYRSWLQALGHDVLEVGDAICFLGSSCGWQRLNRPRPNLRRSRAPALRVRDWVIAGLDPVEPPAAPALPLLCAVGLEVRGDLDHLKCLDLSRAQTLRQVASHGLRGSVLTWRDVRWALTRHRELPGRDWRERARTDEGLLYPVQTVLSLGRGWRATVQIEIQAVRWDGGGVLLPHYRWRGASTLGWWDDRCRRYAS